VLSILAAAVKGVPMEELKRGVSPLDAGGEDMLVAASTNKAQKNKLKLRRKRQKRRRNGQKRVIKILNFDNNLFDFALRVLAFVFGFDFV